MQRRDGSYLNTGTIARFTFAAVMFLLYFVARAIFKGDPELCRQYCEMMRAVFLIMSGALSYIKAAAAEYILYLLIAGSGLYLIFTIIKMCTKGHVGARLARIAANAAALYSIFLILFFALYGPAYMATPLAERLELEEVSTSDVHKLCQLTEYMRDRANEYADLVPRDVSGDCEFGSFETMSSLTVSAFEAAQATYREITGPYAPAKTTKNESLLSTMGISGIFVPYTAEVVLNPAVPDSGMIFTMAHEMSHRLSIAPEGEANFLAFVVCRASADRRVNYSGYFMAYRSCISALSAVDPEVAGEIQAEVGVNLSHDLASFKDYVLSLDGMIANLGNTVNDSYLKAQGQESGISSYGEMVDLLLAEYASVL